MADVLLVKGHRFVRPHQGPVRGRNGRQYFFPKVRGTSACMVDPKDAVRLLAQRKSMPGGSMVFIYRKATVAEVTKWEREHP